MTTDNGTPASIEGAAGSEQQQQTEQQQNVEVKPEVKPGVVDAGTKPEAKPAPKEVPPMPTQVPPEGAEYIYDEKSGLWKVRRIADDIARAIDRREAGEDDDETPAKGDEAAGKAVAEAVHLPEILPDQMQHDEDLSHHVTEVATVLGETGYTAPQIQRLVDLGGELALDVQQPHYENREEVEGHLRKRWGSQYDNNLKATRSAANKLGSKFLDWLDQGHGNNIIVCEVLSALGRGDLSLNKAAATAEIAKLRTSPAMKDRYHKDHTFAVTKLRILSEVVHRGTDDGRGFEESVSKVLTSQIKQVSRGEKLPTPAAPAPAKSNTAGGEARIAQIRSKLATAKNGTAEWRELRVALNNAYAETYPGTQS
jgi:hypothetical protein